VDAAEGDDVCGDGEVSYRVTSDHHVKRAHLAGFRSALADLASLVNGNLIPYLDFAHSTLLPAEMRTHMNRNVMTSLSPIVSFTSARHPHRTS
jgi:hypothetical protein